MSDFITPPGHMKFQAKMLATDLNATILDSAVAYVEPGGGGPAPSHTHEKDHLFIVVDGCATIKLENESVVLKKDETLYVKGAVEHSVWNETNQSLKIIKINCIHK
ncbi:cupin domain-containing protein [Propionispora hippei]|uniref:Cupin domain-containing protein n=1 Tax=Propionispora hippei DSM 15287 TaxID=1123003 RepID=A0A1M6MSV5_9FIRM|nr:cupin domain-containing protein [Propionispora hippei]SHJ86486.1 Cupin domain-containing protein [Propionispora hippei DSM 15287]